MGAPMAADRYLKRGFNTEEAATYIGRSVSWLQKKRLRGVEDPGEAGPRFRKSETGYAIYLREDLDAWLEDLPRNDSPVSNTEDERDADSARAGV